MRLQATRRSRTASNNGIEELERKAAEAASLLKLLANENRLLILCRLVVAGEMSVGDLADAVDFKRSRRCLNILPRCAKMASSPRGAKRRRFSTISPIQTRHVCLRCSRTSTAPDRQAKSNKEKYRG